MMIKFLHARMLVLHFFILQLYLSIHISHITIYFYVNVTEGIDNICKIVQDNFALQICNARV